MDITFLFFLGLFVALIGVIPPGLLNMTAAKIALKDGYGRGIMFSIGACIIVAIQTCLATMFAKYLNNHPDIVDILQRVAFVVFILVSIYYLKLAQKQPKPQINTEPKSKQSRFFQGMFLSSINLLPIPYQAYMTLTFASFGWMTFDTISITSYVAGATSGTFVMLYIYIFFFDKIKSKRFTSQKGMNYIIGSISAAIAIVTLVKIIQEL